MAASKTIGVVICDFPKSGDCLTAMEWVHEIGIQLPKGYKLCVILIETDAKYEGAKKASVKDNKGVELKLGSWGEVEAALTVIWSNAGKEAKKTVKKFQDYAGGLKENHEEDVFGKMYEGPSIQKTLEFAINNDFKPPAGLHTLIVPNYGVHAASSSSSSQQIELRPVESSSSKKKQQDESSSKKKQPVESSSSLKLPAGCSIVLVPKKDGVDVAEKKGKKSGGANK